MTGIPKKRANGSVFVVLGVDSSEPIHVGERSCDAVEHTLLVPLWTGIVA